MYVCMSVCMCKNSFQTSFISQSSDSLVKLKMVPIHVDSRSPEVTVTRISPIKYCAQGQLNPLLLSTCQRLL